MMKKSITLLLTASLACAAVVAAQDTEIAVDVLGKGGGKFSEQNIFREESRVIQGIFGGAAGDRLMAIKSLADGNVLLAGTVAAGSPPVRKVPRFGGPGPAFVALLSDDVRTMKRMFLLPSEFLSAKRIEPAPDGTVLVAGECRGGGLVVARLDASLERVLWIRRVDGDALAGLSVAPDNSVLVCPEASPFVSRIAADGKFLIPFGAHPTFRTDGANPDVKAAWWEGCGYAQASYPERSPVYHRGGSGGVVALTDGTFVLLTSNFLQHPGGGPDFDLMMLRFDADGHILWCTNLLDGLPAESDQKSPSIALDPHTGDLLVSATQHGHFSHNLLLTPGAYLNPHEWLTGDIAIGWIARIDPATGKPKAATFYFPEIPGPLTGGKRRANSLFPRALAADAAGHIFVTGSTSRTLPTTLKAFQSEALGGCGFVTVFTPDLSRPLHAGLITSRGGNFEGTGIGLVRGAPAVIGTYKKSGPDAWEFTGANASVTNFLTNDSGSAEGTFVGFYPAFSGSEE